MNEEGIEWHLTSLKQIQLGSVSDKEDYFSIFQLKKQNLGLSHFLWITQNLVKHFRWNSSQKCLLLFTDFNDCGSFETEILYEMRVFD